MHVRHRGAPQLCRLDTHGHTNSGQTQHRNEGARAAEDPNSSTQRRGAPCLVRTVNCAVNKTERHKPLVATSVREDVAGDSTVIAAACSSGSGSRGEWQLRRDVLPNESKDGDDRSAFR